MSWVGAFHATRESYHYGISAGVIPNLHIKANLLEAFSGDAIASRFGDSQPASGNDAQPAKYE